MASEEERKDFRARMAEALEKGMPVPEFPTSTPLEGVVLATKELVETFESQDFSRWESLYLAQAVMNGTPGTLPK